MSAEAIPCPEASAPMPVWPGAPQAANSPAPTAPLTPYAGQPRLPQAGLRLLPLDGFHWGSGPRAGMPRTARVRGESCLIRVTAGTLRLILPGRTVEHGAGSIIFVPAGTAFSTLPLPGAAGHVLLLSHQAAERMGIPLPVRIVAGAADDAALAGAENEAALRRIDLIAASLHRLATAPALADLLAPRHDSRSLFAAFVELAARELGRGRTVADLADALGTTAAGLDAVCRSQRGRTALEVMYDLRLDRARIMLADPAQSLVRIAAELGFSGVAHLNRSFVAATGRTAEAFRRG